MKLAGTLKVHKVIKKEQAGTQSRTTKHRKTQKSITLKSVMGLPLFMLSKRGTKTCVSDTPDQNSCQESHSKELFAITCNSKGYLGVASPEEWNGSARKSFPRNSVSRNGMRCIAWNSRELYGIAWNNTIQGIAWNNVKLCGIAVPGIAYDILHGVERNSLEWDGIVWVSLEELSQE
jgi:hypothetical protein